MAGEEIGSPEVGAAAVSGARLPHLQALPRPREERGAGDGCSCWGDWETSLPLLPLPPLQSRAAVRRSPQTPGNLALAAPPLRGSLPPPPGLGSPQLPACQEAPGVPVCGQRDPGAIEWGCREKLQ